MAYDEALAERIRSVLRPRHDVAEVKMFGGLTFMVAERMAVGVVGGDLMVRIGSEAMDAALAEPHTRPMDFTGRPMRGMLYVAPSGTAGDADLARWIEMGTSFAMSQPPRKAR